MTADTPQQRRDLAGRVIGPDGELVQFVTFSTVAPSNAEVGAELAEEQIAAIVDVLADTEYRLVDRYGDEVDA